MVTTGLFRVAAQRTGDRTVNQKDGNRTHTQLFITEYLSERKKLIHTLLSISYEPQRLIHVLSPTYISLSRSGQDLQWTLTRADRKGREQSTEDIIEISTTLL